MKKKIFRLLLILLFVSVFCFITIEFINYMLIKPKILQEIVDINLTKAGNKAELYIENTNNTTEERYFSINFVSYSEIDDKIIRAQKYDFINSLKTVFNAKTGEILPLEPKIPLKMKIYKITKNGEGVCCGKIFKTQKHNFYQKYELIYDKTNHLQRAYLQTSIYVDNKKYGVNRAVIDKIKLEKGFYKIEIENLKDLPEFFDIKTYFGTSDSGLKP